MDPMVDVLMPVYNHERYIAQAIEGVVMQQTNFKFRLLIGEDCSKDGSKAIIEKYAASYPGVVVPIYHNPNIGAGPNSRFLFRTATAKYIAMCEGDDYWTDPLKLQKQVDCMEADPGLTMCFTEVKVIDEVGLTRPDVFAKVQKDIFTFGDIVLAATNFIPIPTLMFRNLFTHPMPQFYINTTIGDAAIFMILADKGNAKYLKDVTAVYRHHSGGFTKSDFFRQNEYEIAFRLFTEANEYFKFKYDEIFKKRISGIVRTLLIYGARDKKGMERIKHVRKYFPRYLKYADGVNVREVFYYLTVLLFPSLLKLKTKK